MKYPWKGKVVGAGLGAVVGFAVAELPPWAGIGIGLVLGQIRDARLAWRLRELNNRRFLLLVKAATADGALTPRKQARLHRFARAQVKGLGAKFIDGIIQQNLEKVVVPERLSSLLRGQPAKEQQKVLHSIASIFFSEGKQVAAQEAWVARLIQAAGVSAAFWDHVLACYQRKGSRSQAVHEARKLLGLKGSESMDEIRLVWRGKVSSCHPDLVAGDSDDRRAAAEEITRALNGAYELLTANPEAEPVNGLVVINLSGGKTARRNIQHGFVCLCPICRRKNRITDAGQAEAGRCAHCHALLAVSS